MERREVVLEGEVPISGTLTLPNGGATHAPAILLLAGSGRIDRDGNGRGARLNLYNQLAERLTDLGYVTFRFDKRGTGKSGGRFVETGFWDLVEDGNRAVRFLQSQPFVKNGDVLVLGHSEGCMLATAMARDVSLAGLILASGAVESLNDAMVFQRTQMKEDVKQAAGFKGKLLRLLKVGEKVEKQGERLTKKVTETDKDVIRQMGMRVSAKWFREHFAFDVREALKHVTCPVLAITGEYDVQVTPERVHEIHELVQGKSEAVVVPKVNHMLRDQEEQLSILDLKKAYKKVGDKPISEEFMIALSRWLEKNAPLTSGDE
ncbi:alpha/beta hydrolase [Halalkalibacterium ligniniphilum]|uniref:alpha/beta hydrolase n=1 Tax=Halalkalibacterium ligniniphilum TaxID=1134413 RepID=UPI000347A608|nr:alpha/beta hydrolase [Halalkalibacterium ligniniphilum]